MAEQIIRDFYGKIIAKIETKPNGATAEFSANTMPQPIPLAISTVAW